MSEPHIDELLHHVLMRPQTPHHHDDVDLELETTCLTETQTMNSLPQQGLVRMELQCIVGGWGGGGGGTGGWGDGCRAHHGVQHAEL